MDEIIVIRVADPDGSLFEAIIDALKNKRAEVVHVAAPFSSVLRVGDLEIYLDQQRVLMSGREVRLNHGEYRGVDAELKQRIQDKLVARIMARFRPE